MRKILMPAVVLLAACGGSSSSVDTGTASRISSPQTASAFMRAAADSNLARMAQLWGTSRGPASETRPDNYEKRLVVLQAYLRGDSTRVVSDMPVQGDANHRRLVIALYRGTCVKQIPVTTVRSKGAWIVEAVDISAAGNPARPCEPGTGRL